MLQLNSGKALITAHLELLRVTKTPRVRLKAVDRWKKTTSESGDRVGWNRLSNAFHVELARLIDNHVLFDIMNTLCARSSLIVAVFDAQRHEKRAINPHTHSEHREILDLLVNGKRNRVVKVMRKHLSACVERLERKYEGE